MLESDKNYVNNFMEKNNLLINKLSNKNYDYSGVGLSAFKSIVKSALDNAYNNYLNKNNNTNFLEKHLHGTLNITNNKIVNEYKKDTLICPGCRENNHIEVLNFTSNGLCCSNCFKESINNNSLIHSTFSMHSSNGFRCPNCSKFIPNIVDEKVICPYKNCGFKGNKSNLQKMDHPTVKIDRVPVFSNLEYLPSDVENSVDKLSTNEEINIAYKAINECIDTQIKVLHFKGYAATYVSRLCSYKAFRSSMDKYPEDIIPYLTNVGRTGGSAQIQSKILQEFINHLEEELPFSYIKNGKKYKIESLLDENLKIFNGESIFQTEINDKYEILNKTKEVYTGSRNGYYCQPFYIGKLLEVKALDDDKDITSYVKEYGCIKIHMDQETTKPGTKVQVKHLRIPPHYAMGAFVYLNRQKKILTEKVQSKLKRSE